MPGSSPSDLFGGVLESYAAAGRGCPARAPVDGGGAKLQRPKRSGSFFAAEGVTTPIADLSE